jgi:hypothetical protein
LKLGVNGSAAQPLTWNGLAAVVTLPNVEVNAVSVASAPQFVGLNRKLPRSTATLSVRKRSGTPLTIVGSPLLTTTRPVCASTLIAARVTTVPKLNGPAAARIAIDRP